MYRFLGVHIDNNLTFSNHDDNIISNCSFKILGMNAEGFKNFYCANTRSLLSYAALPGSLCLAISSHPGKIFTGIEPEAF